MFSNEQQIVLSAQIQTTRKQLEAVERALWLVQRQLETIENHVQHPSEIQKLGRNRLSVVAGAGR